MLPQTQSPKTTLFVGGKTPGFRAAGAAPIKLAGTALLFLLLAAAAQADVDPRVIIAKQFPGTRVEDIRPSPVAGLYELTHGADIVYVTADGKYALNGDLLNLANNDNITESHRRAVRAQL